MSNHMFFIRVNYVAKHELWILLWQMTIKIFMDMHQGNDLNWPLKIKNTNFTDFQSRKTLIYFYINIINRNGKQYIIVAKLRETFKLCFFMLKRDAVIKILDVVYMVNFRDGRFLILTKNPSKKSDACGSVNLSIMKRPEAAILCKTNINTNVLVHFFQNFLQKP